MTRKEAVELLPFIKAFSEGKVIQISNERGEWDDLTEREGLPIGTLRAEPNSFRIKPEPKYRPFKDAEECWQEMKNHQPFGWVKDKEDGKYSLITSIYSDVKEVHIDGISGLSLYAFSSYYTFADGTPFGILEEK